MQFSLKRLMIAMTLFAMAAAVASWTSQVQSTPIRLPLKILAVLLPGITIGYLFSDDAVTISLTAIFVAWVILFGLMLLGALMG